MSAGLKFDPEWRITLFTLLLVPVMVSLGFWQLQRADDKAELAIAFEQKQLRSPALLGATLQEQEPDALAYLPVRLLGRFREHQYFLLDNRIQGGRYGNEVLGVFELADGGLALVNRGWIAADASRMSLPRVPAVLGELDITGHIYVAPGEPYLLADHPLDSGWPKRIQAVEMNKLAAPLPAGHTLFPYPVRIDAGQSGALGVNWQVINVSPAKHRGYAVQWFTMAAVLALFYLLRCSNLWQLLRRAPNGDAHNE
jgi:cytochrome oxidase assembly protein ShyY1